MGKTIKEQLLELAEPSHQKFSASLIPNVNNILGVRMPHLRQLAKNIVKGDWRAYLKHADDEFLEETMLQGLVIGYAKADINETLGYVSNFVPKINNWSVCDSLCTGLKITNKHKEQVWEFLQPYLSSDKEYEIRFGVVMLLNYYMDEKYIASVLDILDRIKHEGYYVKMAVAWALSFCYIKQPEPTYTYLTGDNTLDKDTFNKALQKIIDSFRVDAEMKNVFRSMKRK